MNTAPNRIRRAARQQLQTCLLMGVDFIPRFAQPVAEDGQAALDALCRRHDEECPHCSLATGHTRTVFGEGRADADLMFVGEAPGEQEDRTGRPFVGRAG